jgi:hypothetical protein
MLPIYLQFIEDTGPKTRECALQKPAKKTPNHKAGKEDPAANQKTPKCTVTLYSLNFMECH